MFQRGSSAEAGIAPTWLITTPRAQIVGHLHSGLGGRDTLVEPVLHVIATVGVEGDRRDPQIQLIQQVPQFPQARRRKLRRTQLASASISTADAPTARLYARLSAAVGEGARFGARFSGLARVVVLPNVIPHHETRRRARRGVDIDETRRNRGGELDWCVRLHAAGLDSSGPAAVFHRESASGRRASLPLWLRSVRRRGLRRLARPLDSSPRPQLSQLFASANKRRGFARGGQLFARIAQRWRDRPFQSADRNWLDFQLRPGRLYKNLRFDP